MELLEVRRLLEMLCVPICCRIGVQAMQTQSLQESPPTPANGKAQE